MKLSPERILVNASRSAVAELVASLLTGVNGIRFSMLIFKSSVPSV